VSRSTDRARVAVDARPALGSLPTGVGHYAARLIRHLPEADPGTEYVAWYLHARGLFHPRRFFGDVHARNLTEKASRFPARLFEPVSSRLRVPRVEWLTGPFDAFLATNFLPPPTRSRAVVLVVHDLAFRIHPETAPHHHDARWHRAFARGLEAAARVIVPSASAKADLVAFEGVDPAKVVVVHHGADRFVPPPPEDVSDVRARLGLAGPYALSVAGLDPRKNLANLVEAFSRVSADAMLVIAGGRVPWFPEEADRLASQVETLPAEVRRRVILTGYVTETDKRALIAGATALLYPSRYEGFGFPVLEGFSAGVPVLTSTVSSLPEVAGDAALLVDHEDVGAIAEGIGRLLADADLRTRLVAAGRERAATFTWKATALRTAEVLHEAAAEGRR